MRSDSTQSNPTNVSLTSKGQSSERIDFERNPSIESSGVQPTHVRLITFEQILIDTLNKIQEVHVSIFCL